MARIEKMNDDMGEPGKPKIIVREIFNVSAPVGPKMPNLFADVMVIQALLNFIALHPIWLEKFRREDMPWVNGLYDRKTELTIRNYQSGNSIFLARVDGIVHPGSYGNRIIKSNGPSITITQLNDEADMTNLLVRELDSADSHIESILKKYPQLNAIINGGQINNS
jgi:hypothetical protein